MEAPSTRRSKDKSAQLLALRATAANDAQRALAMQQRRQRHDESVTSLEEQIARMQRELTEKTTAMGTLQNHLSRIREKEAAALDAKKLAETQMKKMQRNELELQLRVVAAEAKASAIGEARERVEAEAVHEKMAMAKEAKTAELDAAALEARNEKLRKSVAQLAGRIGGGRSSKRSADEVAQMPRESKQQRDNYRSAKHRMVTNEKLPALLRKPSRSRR